MTTAITVFLAVLIMTLLFRSVGRTRAVERVGALVFGGTAAVRWMMIACTLIMVALGVAVFLLDQNRSEGMWIGLVFAAFGALVVFGMPAEIEISEQGITSKRWWSAAKSLRWAEVESVSEADEQKPFKVFGTNGTTGSKIAIMHTIMNVDRARFVAEVNKRRMSGAGAGR